LGGTCEPSTMVVAVLISIFFPRVGDNNPITKIPVIGGYFARTDAPETCTHRFSNEATLPGPLRYPCFRSWCEHAAFPRCFGSLGCGFAASARTPIMCLAFALSLGAWIAMMLSALAMGNSENALDKFQWAKATLDGPLQTVEIKAGIKYILAEFTNKSSGVVTEEIQAWDDGICGSWASLDTMKEACNSCKDTATGSAMFIVLSLITQIAQITTDLQRATAYGDINCQKLFGFTTSVFGCLSGLGSMVTFANSCWKDLPDTITFNDSTITADWDRGAGYMLMLVAVILKAIDAFIHLITPTPPNRHRTHDPAPTLKAYMKEGIEGVQMDSSPSPLAELTTVHA